MTHGTPSNIDVGALAQLATSKEVASLIGTYFQSRQHLIELRVKVEKIRRDYDELAIARQDDMSDRDLDRLATRAITELLIGAGQYEAATAIFNNFIDKRPRFAKEVADLILGSNNNLL